MRVTDEMVSAAMAKLFSDGLPRLHWNEPVRAALEAALAQQAGADYKHVATISQTKFGSYWIDWHEKVAYRKGLKLFASSAPGGGGEVS